MPMTAPPLKATARALFRLSRAALVVRTLARVAIFMPKKPASAGGQGAQHEGEPISAVAAGQLGVAEGQQHGHDDHEDGQNLVLAAQEGHGAFLNVTGDGLHLLVAGILALDPWALNRANSSASTPAAGMR